LSGFWKFNKLIRILVSDGGEFLIKLTIALNDF